MKKTKAHILLILITLFALSATACDVPYADVMGSKAQSLMEDVRYDLTGNHDCTPGLWQTQIEAEDCQNDGFRCRFCTRCGALFDCERVKVDHIPGKITPGETLTCKTCQYAYGTVPYFSVSEEEQSAAVTGFGLLSILSRSSYKTLYIPDFYEETPVRTVSSYAFYGYSSLTSAHLPATLEAIGEYAFEGCKNLCDFYYGGTVENWNAITFGENWDLGTVAYSVHCSDGTIAVSH